jgi:hypothetical protein
MAARQFPSKFKYVIVAFINRSFYELRTTCYRPNNQERLLTLDNRVWQRRFRRFMRQILLARKESHERPPLAGCVIAQSAAERRISGLERIYDGGLGDRPFDFQPHLAFDTRQNPQMRR